MYIFLHRLRSAALVGLLTPTLVWSAETDPLTNPATNKNEPALETMVVSAAREPLALERVGSAVSILDAETLARRQATNLGELLRSLPGIAVSRAGGVGAQTQLRLRGSEANHVKVLVDGIVVNDAGQGDEFNIAHLFNSQLAQVELLRGPQSSLWGSDAVGGVLSIRSTPPPLGIKTEVFVEGGNEDFNQAAAQFGYANEQGFLQLGVQRLETDGHNVAREGRERDGYEGSSARLGAGIALTDNISVSTHWLLLDSTTEFDSVDFATGLVTDRDNETDADQVYGRLAADIESWGGRWRQQFGLAITAQDNANRVEDPFTPGGFDRSTVDSKRVRANYESHFDVTSKHTLSLGLEHERVEFRQRGAASFFGDPNRNEASETAAVAIEYRGALAEDVYLQLSARHDRNSDFEDTFTWRASSAWQVNKIIKLRGALGVGVKNPTFSERFGFFTNFIGNPALEPETSESWEVGADLHVADGLDIQLTYFQAELQDEINGFVFVPSVGAFTADNERGESERRGVELSAAWSIAESLDLRGSYSWLDATEDEFGREVREVRRARHTGSLELAWQPRPDLLLSLRGDHNGRQDDLFFPPVPPFQERVELEAFTLVTLTGKADLTDRLSLHARVENALDEEYEEIFGFATPGRTFVVGLSFKTNRK